MDIHESPHGLLIHSTNITYKLAGYSSVLLVADYLLPGLYPSLWPLFFTVVVLTTVGAVADMWLVPRVGNLPALTLGFFGMTLLIFGCAWLWPQTHVTPLRAAAMAVGIAPLEYALHRYVLRGLFARKV